MEDFDNAKTRNPRECVVTNLNSYLTYISDIKENWLSKWVKYYIDSPAGQAYIEQNLNTTVQATLNIKTLVDMLIPFPKEDEMRKIVTILDAIDRKIECDQQINDNLAA